MDYLSVEEFLKYMDNDEVYIYNARVDMAYRSVKINNDFDKVFCKRPGGQEIEILSSDEDYCQSWFMTTVMTKEEYENF